MTKKAKNKYYVVWRGITPGIYGTWEECKKQIMEYEGAQYKSFKDKEEAELAYSKSYFEITELKGKKNLHELSTNEKPLLNSISVDAACKGNPGTLEFRGVFTDTGTELFSRGPYEMGTVNIGEFLAIVLALAWLKKNKLNYPVYTDSRTAMAWIRNKKVNTKLQRTDKNKEVFKALDDGVSWLKNNTFTVPILKWKTDFWGEIHADYGRK
ncbi:MAG: ribonuclease H family protein [Bacteroidetes bacterium]|nr:ribonuclease H family protein [Bacteroidota bacterium]MBL6942830.1 ribonuclease H family protein [Bacteroidales bacterium]